MIFFGLTIILGILAYWKYSFIKKNASKLYIAMTCIMLVDISFQYYLFANKTRLQGILATLESLLSRAIIGTALISVVMLIGALNSKWDIVKKLRSIRAEISIIACILILPHNVLYMFNTFRTFSKVWSSDPSAYRTVTLCISATGIITVTLLIPLFITSFTTIRKKMKAKSWKNLQRLAYPFYILIYLQIMLVHLGYDNRRNYIEAIGYSLIFVPYMVLRLKKYFSNKQKKLDKQKNK